MKISFLGLLGFAKSPGATESWARIPRGFKLVKYYDTRRVAEFTGLTFVYTLRTWDKKFRSVDEWRWQWQDKHVPILGTWLEAFPVRDQAQFALHLFGFKFWRKPGG